MVAQFPLLQSRSTSLGHQLAALDDDLEDPGAVGLGELEGVEQRLGSLVVRRSMRSQCEWGRAETLSCDATRPLADIPDWADMAPRACGAEAWRATGVPSMQRSKSEWVPFPVTVVGGYPETHKRYKDGKTCESLKKQRQVQDGRGTEGETALELDRGDTDIA